MTRLQTAGMLSDVGDRESVLPETRRLALTRNYFWVMVVCVGSVLSVPVLIGWVASTILR